MKASRRSVCAASNHGTAARELLPAILLLLVFASPSGGRAAENLGPWFEHQRDVGAVAKTGSASYNAASETLTITGGGENMWFTNDAFHLVWTRVSGDFELSAAIQWIGSGGNAHRKACLVARQGLGPDAAYVDVVVHGDGLTSLQFRTAAGGPTREVQFCREAPAIVGLARQGDSFVALVGAEGQAPAPAGGFIRVALADPVYLGIGVCAHDNTVTETARFGSITLKRPQYGPDKKPILHCALETITVASKDRRLVYHMTNHIEAPNWTRDGKNLIFNSGGRLLKLPVLGGKPEVIDTGFAVRCNNDHGLSPDGSRLVISDQTRGGKSLIYVLPATGGTPQLITPLGPSYWHGWSPEGATLVYCAERNGLFDVYSIPATGGEEKRLTTAQGLDDGPEYSHDGKLVYFNSDRTGRMQIWRMKPDGSDQEQVTNDEFNNWFPHPSPDGKWIAILSYEKDVEGHPANKPVRLRLISTADRHTEELAQLFGGQGTINVPSWSPDSRQLAFVSYELLK